MFSPALHRPRLAIVLVALLISALALATAPAQPTAASPPPNIALTCTAPPPTDPTFPCTLDINRFPPADYSVAIQGNAHLVAARGNAQCTISHQTPKGFVIRIATRFCTTPVTLQAVAPGGGSLCAQVSGGGFSRQACAPNFTVPKVTANDACDGDHQGDHQDDGDHQCDGEGDD